MIWIIISVCLEKESFVSITFSVGWNSLNFQFARRFSIQNILHFPLYFACVCHFEKETPYFSTVTFSLSFSWISLYFSIFTVCVFVFWNSSFSIKQEYTTKMLVFVFCCYYVRFSLLVQVKEENKSTVSDKWIFRIIYSKLIFGKDWQEIRPCLNV